MEISRKAKPSSSVSPARTTRVSAAAAAARPADPLSQRRHGPHRTAQSRQDLPVRRHGVRGAARREPVHRPGRVRGHHRLVGLGQVDADEHPRLPRFAVARQLSARRSRRGEAVAHRARQGAQRIHRFRVPELQPAQAHLGRRERRVAADLRARAARRAPQAREGGARSRRPLASRRAPSVAVVGRPAAARGDRARARHQPAADPRR